MIEKLRKAMKRQWNAMKSNEKNKEQQRTYIEINEKQTKQLQAMKSNDKQWDNFKKKTLRINNKL